MNQVHSVARNLTATVVGGLCDDRGCRGGVAVAACGDVGIEAHQGVVDEQCIVHVASRRADVHHHLRGGDLGYAGHLLAEPVEGGNACRGVLKLMLIQWLFECW